MHLLLRFDINTGTGNECVNVHVCVSVDVCVWERGRTKLVSGESMCCVHFSMSPLLVFVLLIAVLYICENFFLQFPTWPGSKGEQNKKKEVRLDLMSHWDLKSQTMVLQETTSFEICASLLLDSIDWWQIFPYSSDLKVSHFHFISLMLKCFITSLCRSLRSWICVFQIKPSA